MASLGVARVVARCLSQSALAGKNSGLMESSASLVLKTVHTASKEQEAK